MKKFENGKKNESKIVDLYQSIKKVKIENNNKKMYRIFINNDYEK